jgi:hypothetical protein
MRSIRTARALALMMAVAMIATVIAVFPAATQAAGAWIVTGEVRNDVTGNVTSGVTVIIANSTATIKNTTTDALGRFTLYIDAKEWYNLSFVKSGYKNKTTMHADTTFNDTTQTAETGITLIEPLPQISGTIRELGTITGISGVDITIKNQTSGQVINHITTGASGQFSQFIDANVISLYYKKDGYYDNANESITLPAHVTTDIGYVYLEKVVPTPTITVWGVIFQNGTTNTLNSTIVSIHKGDEKWITAVSDSNGKYEMLAYPGSFQVKASLKGYYTNLSQDWLSIPSDSVAVRRDIFLDKTPAEPLTLMGTVSDGINPIPNAEIMLHSNDGKYVNQTSTDGAGAYSMMYYDSSFKLEVRKEGNFTYVAPWDITNANNSIAVDIVLQSIIQPWKLQGFVSDSSTSKYIVGASLTLYDKTHLYINSATTGSNGHYEFMVHTGTSYVLVIDASGYQSTAVDIGQITQDTYKEIKLDPSLKNVTKTTFTFVNWTTVNVMQNKTIIVDNVTTRVDAERKYGMGTLGLALCDWSLTQAEADSWTADLERKGLEQKLTTDFFTLDDIHYKMNDSYAYDVTIVGAVTTPSNITNTISTIYVNSTYQYIIDGTLPDINATEHSIVLNATYDDSVTNYSYNLILPLTPTKFEMTYNSTETVYVDVTGFNDPIIIDTKENTGEESDTVKLLVKTSLNGSANGKITNGLYYELNNTFDNYTVLVRMGSSDPVNTTVTLSAYDSTDPIGDITMANFSWDFESDGAYDAWGVEVEHNFTSASQSIVLLRVIETGGNYTWQNLTVKVDGVSPNANISIDTSNANVTFASNTLTTNEDLILTFNGMAFSDVEGTMPTFSGTGSSTDGLYAQDDGLGIIEKWFWCWGEDGIQNETVTMEGSNNITHTYAKPGLYTLIMNVTDVVGHVSSNAVWAVTVKDITSPEPLYTMTNSTGADAIEAIENEVFTFNASTSTDNFDEVAAMTFQWDFDSDGTIDATGVICNYTFASVSDYNVTLIAFDSALNQKNLTKTVHSSIGNRPNLFMKFGTMKFSEETGTAGSDMTISVNLTNDGQVDATDVSVKFYIRNEDGTDTEITGTVTMFSTTDNATIADGIISADENVTATITWSPEKKGNYSIWANSSTPGEHSSQYWDNKIDDFDVQQITVEQAGWVLPVIILVVIIVIIVVFLGMRYFMRSKTETETDEGKRFKK